MFEVIKGKYTIKQILKDNWDDFYAKHKNYLRPVVIDIDNVVKVMNCGNREKLGYSIYSCPLCKAKHIVAHACKSRFCNSCGKVKNDEWIIKSQNRLINVPHKHLVFTIPSELWLLVATKRRLITHLFQSTAQSILDWANTKHFMPGVDCVIHTFGS